MSIKVMSAVWEIEGIDSSECLVLMALADHADDNGRCYPSIARLAKRTKLSDRGVQKVISRLIEKGFVTVVPAAGQGGANVYIVTATPTVPVVAVAPEASSRDVDAQLRWWVYKRDAYSCRYCGFQGHEDGHNLTVDHIVPVSKGGTNAESNLNTCCFSCNSSKKNKDLDAWLEHRVNHVHPEPRSPRTTGTIPPNHVRKTPESRSPKPSRTTIEPSDMSVGETPLSVLCGIVSKRNAESFLKVRKEMKKPVSIIAAERLAISLAKIADLGGDPNDALGMCQEKGWLSIKPDWYFKDHHNDRRSSRTDQRAASRTDALRDQLDVAGRMRKTSQPNWI